MLKLEHYTWNHVRSGEVARLHAQQAAVGAAWHGRCVHRILSSTRAFSVVEFLVAKVVLFVRNLIWPLQSIVLDGEANSHQIESFTTIPKMGNDSRVKNIWIQKGNASSKVVTDQATNEKIELTVAQGEGYFPMVEGRFIQAPNHTNTQTELKMRSSKVRFTLMPRKIVEMVVEEEPLPNRWFVDRNDKYEGWHKFVNAYTYLPVPSDEAGCDARIKALLRQTGGLEEADVIAFLREHGVVAACQSNKAFWWATAEPATAACTNQFVQNDRYRIYLHANRNGHDDLNTITASIIPHIVLSWPENLQYPPKIHEKQAVQISPERVRKLGRELMRAMDMKMYFQVNELWFIVAEYVFGDKMSRTGLEPARLAAQEPKS